MMLKDLLVYMDNEKRKKANAGPKAVLILSIVALAGIALGIVIAPKMKKETLKIWKIKAVNTMENIKDKAKYDTVKAKESLENAMQEVSDIVKDAQDKTNHVGKDIKGGYNEIKKEVLKTADDITDELHNPAK